MHSFVAILAAVVCVSTSWTDAHTAPPEQDWFPRAEPLPDPKGDVIRVNDVGGLFRAARDVKPGGTILLADGRYQMPRYFAISTDRVTLRSASGNRHVVILDGSDSRHGELFGISKCTGVTIADLTISNIKYNGFKINSDSNVQRLTIRNCVIHNIWQRGVKAVRARTTKPEGCVIEYCLFYNDRPKKYGDDPADTAKNFQGNYIGGIDAMDAVGWTIRDNVFVGLQGRTREGRGAIFVWQNARDCTIERNVIIDCDAGISLGNPSKPGDVDVHCTGFTVRNNFITRAPEQSIFAAYTKDCRILHNTIHDPANRLRRSIRVLLANDGLTIAGNLIDGPKIIQQRTGTSRIHREDNLQGDFTGWFMAPRSGNLRLKPKAAAIDAGKPSPHVTDDIDAHKRDAKPDIGANEFTPKGR